MWESMRPGRIVLPSRSTTCVSSPIVWETSSSDPTATIRLPFTATASAIVSSASTVTTFPFSRTRSADRPGFLVDDNWDSIPIRSSD